MITGDVRRWNNSILFHQLGKLFRRALKREQDTVTWLKCDYRKHLAANSKQ
jgi:hypothetical protein